MEDRIFLIGIILMIAGVLILFTIGIQGEITIWAYIAVITFFIGFLFTAIGNWIGK